jgi:branched-chain amino acid transport system substrate-binding protein
MYYQELEMNAVANWAEAHGLKKGIQIAYDTAFSRYCESALRQRWDRPGSPFELLPSIYMPPGQVEASLEITKAVAKEPDIIFCHFWGAEMVVDALRRFEELGYEGVLMFAGTVLTHEHVATVPEAAEGAYCPYMFVRDTRIPETVEWADRFVAEYGREPSTPAAQAYEATKLLLIAMDKAGTDSDLEKIADAMHSIHFMTPRGEEMRLVKRRSGGAEVYMTRIFLTQAKSGKLVAVDYLPVTMEDYDENKIVD